MTVANLQTRATDESGVPAGQPLLSSKPLIHIGLRNTGSTWLRRKLFGRTDTGFWSPSDMALPGKSRVREHARQLIMDKVGRLIPDEDFDPAVLRAKLEPFVVPPGRCAIFSSERLGGHPLSNGFDRGQLCDRIKQVYSDARILIVIREQRRMILSNYMENLKGGGAGTLQHYLDGKWDTSCSALTFHYFMYDRLIRLYHSAFGAENVLVLPFEMISADPDSFINRICEFSDIPVPEGIPFSERSNARTTYFSYTFLRRIVPLFRSSRGNNYSPALLGREPGKAVHRAMIDGISKIVPKSLEKRTKQRLQRQIEEMTAVTYAASNRETERLIGMDLSAFGYLVDRNADD